jgi:plasmid stabilization system protein ParE
MKYILIVQPEAEAEAAEIFAYLEGVTPGLGDRFFKKLEELYAFLEQFPLAFQKRKKDYRHGFLDRYPYRVAYTVDGNHIHVYQVRHLSRKEDPEFGP